MTVKRLLVVVAVLAVAGCATPTKDIKGAPIKAGHAAVSSPKPTLPSYTATSTPTYVAPQYTPPPLKNPAGTYQSSCDYVLGDYSSGTTHGYRFVVSVTLHNTGNIPTVTKVTGTWFLSGGGTATKSINVRVWPGKSVRTGITLPATQDQIDLYQANAGYDNCKVKAQLVKTFGNVR